jgi:hypothetical protein
MKAVWIVYVAGIIGIFSVASARGWGGAWLPGIAVWTIGGAFVIRWIELAQERRREAAEEEPT